MTNGQGRVIAAATDGACSGNPGPGGWGALIRFEDGSIEELGGFEKHTTNNRMELQAALEILERLKELPRHPNLVIRTDSKYLINGLSQWIAGWKKKGWRTSNGKPVLNQDLWQALDNARLNDVKLEYVKGHSGDPDNDRADQIAVSFSKGTCIALNPKTNKALAPPQLQKLLSRLEMATFFANRGYSLTLNELSLLTEEPIKKLEEKESIWQWRDWEVVALSNSKWKLIEYNQSIENAEEEGNG